MSARRGTVDEICHWLREYAELLSAEHREHAPTGEDYAMARAWMFESANMLEKAREVMQRMSNYGRQSLTDEELLFVGVFTAGADSEDDDG